MQKWEVAGTYKDKTDILDQILDLRGFKSGKDKKEFLNPPLVGDYIKDLSTQFKRDLKASRDLIKQAIADDVAVIIHGDYDADGICATAILYNAIKKELGYENVFAFIPNRFDHGYGLSKGSIDTCLQFTDAKKVLFITVDSGITAVDEVAYIKDLGHDVIITDHHQKPDKLPKADAILWEDAVVGSTLSWLLARALGSKNDRSISLAAMATVTDVQPLLGFNRSIVKRGLEILNKKPPRGIDALKNLADVKGEITAYTVGWVIGPRLNASGRIVDAGVSLSLLTEESGDKIFDIAQQLNEVNVSRQDKTIEMYELASDFDEDNVPAVIVSHNERYHEGIIGLVASRLVKKYYRPSIVISVEGEFGKGSVRSIDGIDIISALRNFDDLFENLGGHPMAAGFTIRVENIPTLEQRLTDFIQKSTDPSVFDRVLAIDLEIPLSLVDEKLLDDLEIMKPFGVGNPEPVFVSRGLTVTGLNWVGKDQNHLSFRVSDGFDIKKAIMFGASANETAANLALGDVVDLAFRVKENLYNGRRFVDLQVVDLRPS